jgi:hypothetical protein
MKMGCKNCHYESPFAIAILLHLIFRHHCKPTKRDVKFALRNGIELRAPLIALRVIIATICYPFHWIYENI